MSTGSHPVRTAPRELTDPESLQDRLGHRFGNADLLRTALTHRSHGTPHNERLEFLGDSVLNFIIAAELYDRFPDFAEGELSRVRTHLVRQEALHRLALSIGLGACLRLGDGEVRSGGAGRPSILADAFEALMGAAYLDGGMAAAQKLLRTVMGVQLDELDPEILGKDAKTRLQEYLQGRRVPLPQYSIIATQGAAHDQHFEVECLIAQLSVRAVGTGSSRRAAEQMSAERALELVSHGK